MNVDRPVAASAILAVGVTLGGLFIGVGFARGRATDRYVEVKGVAERDVTADLALWPLRVVTAGNDLVVAQARIGQNIPRCTPSSSGMASIPRRLKSRAWTSPMRSRTPLVANVMPRCP